VILTQSNSKLLQLGEQNCVEAPMITLSKWREVVRKMQDLKILESDLEENFIIGSGHGGQNLHKTASCVQLKHIPTGIQVKCQATRFRSENRFHARRMICEKLDALINAEKSEKQQAIEKIRRQKRKRSKKAKAKIRESKSQRSEVKQRRKPPQTD